MKMILLHILLFFSVLVFPSMLHAQIESYPYEIGVQFEDAKIITEGSDKYFLCNILLKGTTLPEGCPYFESLQLTFNFDKTCFNLHDSTKSINFTPQNPDYDLTTKFAPYGLRSVMVFYNAPFTMAEVLYTKGNEQSVIGKNLVLDPDVFQLWGVLKWKLLPGAAGRTGISISKEEDYYYNDVSAASTFLENEGVNVRLAFSGCSLDIEIPGAKPVVAQPVFAANQDTVICRPPVESTYTLVGLPTASDSCVWYVSTSPKGAVDASIAEVTRVGKGDKVGVEWKTTTDNKNYYLNVFSMSKGYSSDTVSKKINVIGFPTPTITEESICKENLLTYTPESGITGTWYNPDYSKSAVATTTPYSATEIGFHHLVRERGTCKDTVDKEVEKIDIPTIMWGGTNERYKPPVKYDIANTPAYGLYVAVTNFNFPLDPALDTVFWVKPTNNMAGLKMAGEGMYIHTDQLTVTSLDFEVYVKRKGDGCITNTLTGHTEFFGGEMRVTIEQSGIELCKDGSVILTTKVARGAEPYTWAWYKQGSSDTVRTEAYAATGNATQKYGVKVTDSKGFSAIGAIEIPYNGALTAPKIKAGPNQVIASGDSTILTANAISGDADAWFWGPNKYLSSPGQFSGTKALTETKRFGVHAVSLSGCASNVDSMTVTVDKTTPSSLLSVVVNPRKSAICIGNKVDFVVEAVTGDLTGATFEWLPADDGLSNTNSSTTTYTATASVYEKEYAVLVRKNGQTLAAKTMVNVDRLDAPILELKAPNLVKCSGDTIFIVNNGTIKPTNYHWFINNNPVVVNQDTNYVLTASGNYDIRVVGTTEGACTSDTLRLKEAIGTGAQIVGLTTTVTTCETSGKLEFTSITPTDAPFKWLKPDKTLLNDTDESVSVSVSGDYYIVYGSGTCADTVTIPVRLNNGIEVIGLPNFITSCALNADLKFTSASAASFKWLDSKKTPISGSDNKNPWNVTQSGIYHLALDGGSCSDTIEVSVALGAPPVLMVDKIQTTCGTTHTLLAETSAGAIQWFKGVNTPLANTTVGVADGTSYRVTATDGSCVSDTVDVTVNFSTPPSVNVVAPQTACGSSLTLKGSATGGQLVWLGVNKQTVLTNLTVNVAGTYYAYAKDGSCLSADTVGVGVSFGVSPALVVDEIQTSCNNIHTLLAETSGGTVKWFKGNTLLTSTTINKTDGSDYRVTAIDGSCASDTVDVTVNFGTPPSVNVVAPQTACGNSLTLKGSATGGQLVWLNTDRESILPNLTVNVAGTYYAYAKDGSCFSADTVGVDVSFGVSPVLMVDEIQTSCYNIHTLLAETSGGTVKWFKGVNTPLTNTTVSVADGTSYRVTAVDGSCASDTVDVTVNFGTPPSVSVTTPQTACGNSLTLKGTSTGGQLAWLDLDKQTALTNLTVKKAGTYYAYAKDGSCFSADTVGVDVSFGVSPVLTVDKIQTACGTTHTLLAETSGGTLKWFKGVNTPLTNTRVGVADGTSYRVTSIDGSCASDTVDVTVNFSTPPSVNVVAPQTACGSSLTLKGSATGGQLVWLDTDRESILPNLTVNVAGTYYAYAKDGSCFSADTVGVDVSFGVSPVLMVDEIQTSCNNIHTLLAETSGGTVKWFKGNTLLTSTTINKTDGSDYRVTAVDGSCASDTVDVTVNFGTPPSVNVVAPQTACGNSLTLKGTSTGGQLVWLGVNKQTVLTNLTVNVAGTYYAYAKDGSCFSADTVGVGVSFGVSPALTVDEIQTSCNNTHTLLVETSGGKIQWFKGNTLLTSTTINKTDGSDYRVTAIDGSCASDTVDVTVNFGTPPSVNVTTPQTACGNSLTLKGSATGGQLVWLDTERKNILTNLTVKKAGTYYAYAKDGSCLSSDTVDVTVSFGTPPSVNVTTPQTACGKSLTLKGTSTGGQLVWLGLDKRTALTNLTVKRAGIYYAYAKDGTCLSLDTVGVNVSFGTPPTLTVDKIQTTCGTTHTLSAAASGGAVKWFKGNTLLTSTTINKTDGSDYRVTAVDGSCASDTVDVTVHFGTRPSVNVVAPQTACGNSLTLKGSASGGQLVWLDTERKGVLTNLTVKKAGTYYAYAKDGSCLSADTVGVDVRFGVPPVLMVDKIQTTCETTHTLSATASGGTVKWSDGTGLLSSTTITGTKGTTQVYSVIAIDGSCSSLPETVTVSFGKDPSVNVITPQTACGKSLTLKGSASGGQLVWLGSDKATILTNLTVTTPGKYYVYAKDGSCRSAGNVEVDVQLETSPSINVNTDQLACGSAHVLTATASGGSVHWMSGSTELSNLIVTGDLGDVKTFDVFAKDGTCESAKQTVTVTFGASPVITLSEISCLGDTLWVEGSGSILDTYRWTVDGEIKQNDERDYYVFTTAGSYTVNCVGFVGTCESNSVMATIQINPTPTIAWKTQPEAAVFAGEMISGCVTATGGTAPYTTYAWSVAGISGECFAIRALQPAYAFQAYVVDMNGCMSDTTTTAHVTVTGFGALAVTVEAVYGAGICANGSAILSADVLGGTPPYTYEWYEKGTPDKLVKSVVGNSLNDILTLLTPTAGTYVVKVKDGAVPLAMGEAEVILTTTAKTAPMANAGADLTVKTGEKAVLLGSATPQPANTQWYWTPADQFNDVAEANKQYPLTTKITGKKEFSLYVIDANGCVSQPDTMVVDVSATGVKLQVLPETSTLCQGNTQLLRVVTTPRVADSDITWSPAIGLSVVNNDSTVFTPTASGNYTFIATVVSGGKTYTGRTEVTVNSGSAPKFDLVTSTGNTTLCQQDTVKLKYAAGAERATDYVWSIGGNSVGVDSFYVVNTVGTHEIKVSASSGSCAATEKSISVTVNQGPVIASLALIDSCGRAVVEVAGTGVTSYTWSATPTGAVDATNSNRYVITTTGNFTVEVAATNGSCSMKKQLTGVINERPSLVWGTRPATTPYDQGDNVNVTVMATGGVSPYSYHWLQPTNVTETSGGYNLLNVSLANYTFEVYATDKNGCVSSDTLKESISVTGGAVNVTLASDYGDVICKDGYARLTAKIDGAAVPCTFSWYKGTDLVTAIKVNSVNELYNVLWVAAADADKYTVVVTDENSKNGTANVTVTVDNSKTAPLASAGPDMTIPTGKQTVLLGEVTTAGTPTYQWHWSPADKLSALADTASQFPLTAMLTAQQSYSVYVVDANNCVSGADDVQINVNDATGLCLTATPVSAEVCRDNSVTFESQVTCGTVSNRAVYSWLPNTSLNRADTSVVRFGPATNGVYEYAVSVTENGMTAAARVKVTVKEMDAPKLDISGRGSCLGDTLVVKNNGFTEKEYIWTVDGIVVSEKSHIFVLNVKNVQNVMVYATADNGCSSDTVNRTMKLGMIPSVNITEGSFAEYKDSVFVLNVDNDPLLTATDYTFAWSSTPDNKINGDKDQLAMTSVALSEDVRYIFTATDKNNPVCQGTDTVTAYLIPDAPKLDIDKNADNNIVLSWDPLVNADSARIMFNKWDGYGVASAYKFRHMNKADITKYIVDVSNDTLEFFYVNASRYVAELGQSFHSHASDTVGYMRQWLYMNAAGADQQNFIAYPFDMISSGVITKKDLMVHVGFNSLGKYAVYTLSHWNSSGWKATTASASNIIGNANNINLVLGSVYRIILSNNENLSFLLYGKLPSRFVYNIKANEQNFILSSLSFGKTITRYDVGNVIPTVFTVATHRFFEQKWSASTLSTSKVWGGMTGDFKINPYRPIRVVLQKNATTIIDWVY